MQLPQMNTAGGEKQGAEGGEAYEQHEDKQQCLLASLAQRNNMLF